jgi:hypothetical protein
MAIALLARILREAQDHLAWRLATGMEHSPTSGDASRHAPVDDERREGRPRRCPEAWRSEAKRDINWPV